MLRPLVARLVDVAVRAVGALLAAMVPWWMAAATHGWDSLGWALVALLLAGVGVLILMALNEVVWPARRGVTLGLRAMGLRVVPRGSAATAGGVPWWRSFVAAVTTWGVPATVAALGADAGTYASECVRAVRPGTTGRAWSPKGPRPVPRQGRHDQHGGSRT